jgi:D-lyxose ketol-isomerase
VCSSDLKEEHIRSQYGSLTVYLPGPPVEGVVRIPEGRERWYRCRKGTVLGPGETIFVRPQEPHWFQAGPAGSVSFGFYTAVDESKNLFTDPGARL